MKRAKGKSAALVTLLLLAGLGAVAYSFQEPEFGVKDSGEWTETEEDIELTSYAWVYNPNQFDINVPFLTTEYSVQANDIELARGSRDGLKLPSKENTTVELPADVNTGNISNWWASHLRNGESSRIEASVDVKTDFLMPVTLYRTSYTDTVETDIDQKIEDSLSRARGSYSWNTSQDTGAETRMEVRNVSAEWSKVTQDRTSILLGFEVHNPNSYSVPVPELEGVLEANDVRLIDRSSDSFDLDEAPEDGGINPGETRELRYRTSVDNERIEDWLVSHIENGENTSVNANVQLGFDNGYTEVSVPRDDGMNCSAEIQTALLEDQSSYRNFKDCQTPEPLVNASTSPVTAATSISTDVGSEIQSPGNLAENLSYTEEDLEVLIDIINSTEIYD